MKSTIHPKWNHQAKVICACGNTFETGSTKDEVSVDICYACHPFYTGSMKFLDTQGRVDRFMKLREAAAGKVKKGKKKEVQKEEVRSLKDLLMDEKKKITASEAVAA